MLKDEQHIREAFGKHLKSLRDERDWSQVDLSHAADLDPGYIGKIERGRVNPGLTYLVAIARGLDITLTELMDFKI